MVNSPARLPVCLTDRGVKCPRPVRAGRRERRRPAEAPPLCETRRWTRLLRKFTGGAWERQAPPGGAPSGTPPPAGRGRTWAIHPAALSRHLRGVASRDQPQKRPRFHSVPRRWTRLEFLGLVTAHAHAPRQRSQPSRKASLGRRLPSARPGDRAVGCPVARPLVWGRGGRARSRRSWGFTGTAPAAGSLGRTGPPASILGTRGCAGGAG